MLLRRPGHALGHIAISLGDGRTVEARGANHGVCYSTSADRNWHTGVLVPGVHYGANEGDFPEYSPPQDLLRLTTPYITGDDVVILQRVLSSLGYHPGPVDGIYGPKTQSAVVALQNAMGLVPDGEVGVETLAALQGAYDNIGTGAMPPAGAPAPTDGDWSCSEGWRITGYYTPAERDFPNVQRRSINVGGEDHSFPARFIDTVRLEGWGRTLQGWCLGYYSGRYHREPEPKDSRGRDLEVGAVAVDPRLISRGTLVRIEGVPPIEGRIFTAKDVGGAINDRHIDVYCGEGREAGQSTYSVTRDGAVVCVHT